jgi:hypothetical protein
MYRNTTTHSYWQLNLSIVMMLIYLLMSKLLEKCCSNYNQKKYWAYLSATAWHIFGLRMTVLHKNSKPYSTSVCKYASRQVWTTRNIITDYSKSKKYEIYVIWVLNFSVTMLILRGLVYRITAQLHN